MKIGTSICHVINAVIAWFYRPFRRFVPELIFKYGFTGGLNTCLDIFLYYVAYHYVFDERVLHLPFVAISPHIAAFLFVFPITFTTGFLLAKYITFTRSTLRGISQLLRYIVSVAGSILLNYLLLKLFVECCGFWPTFSKILTTCIVTVYSYLVQMYFSFRR